MHSFAHIHDSMGFAVLIHRVSSAVIVQAFNAAVGQEIIISPNMLTAQGG